MAQPLTYLLDTNIWLERLLDQERASEVKQLLEMIPSDRLLITDFSNKSWCYSKLHDRLVYLPRCRAGPGTCQRSMGVSRHACTRRRVVREP